MEPLPQRLQNLACLAGKTSQSGVLTPGSHEMGGTVAHSLLDASGGELQNGLCWVPSSATRGCCFLPQQG